MQNKFSENLKKLSNLYTQKYIAEKTGFSQSSINNYIAGVSEPSISFLVELKNVFGLNIEKILFGDLDSKPECVSDRFLGNYLVYYYNNDSYKGEVHSNLRNTLNYGVISIFKQRDYDDKTMVCASFMKEKANSLKLLKELNKEKADIVKIYESAGNCYGGNIHTTTQHIFINIANKENEDECSLVFYNPPSIQKYVGGLGTLNSISRGREHNPCIQYVIMTKKIIDKPDGEIYNALQLEYANINFSTSIKDMVLLFKRVYMEKNSLSLGLNEEQKEALIENNLKYFFTEIVEANMFRFSKISNREDDEVFRIIKEGINA